MPKISLPISEKEFKEAGSKFIAIPPDSTGKEQAGDSISLLIECGLPDWDTPGVSMKFPVKVIEKGPNEGKADKISCGVSPTAVWKLKEVAAGFGKSDAVTFESGKPVIDTDAFVGAQAKGIWTRLLSDPEVTGKPAAFYTKLQNVVPASSETETLM